MEGTVDISITLEVVVDRISCERETIETWLEKFFARTTYEISCPVLRDSAVAPEGKTGLVVSLLFDYTLTKHVEDMGTYEAFKSLAETCIIDTLDGSIYPGIKDAILHKATATALTVARMAGTADGAITGWAFSNTPNAGREQAAQDLQRDQDATPRRVPGWTMDVQSIRTADFHPDRQAGGRWSQQETVEGAKRPIAPRFDAGQHSGDAFICSCGRRGAHAQGGLKLLLQASDRAFERMGPNGL